MEMCTVSICETAFLNKFKSIFSSKFFNCRLYFSAKILDAQIMSEREKQKTVTRQSNMQSATRSRVVESQAARRVAFFSALFYFFGDILHCVSELTCQLLDKNVLCQDVHQ